jgi:hypothetical protein
MYVLGGRDLATKAAESLLADVSRDSAPFILYFVRAFWAFDSLISAPVLYSWGKEASMKRGFFALGLLLPLLVVGCATLRFTQDNVKSVLCTQYKDGAAAGTIGDTFDLSGKVCIVSSIQFDDTKSYSSFIHALKCRWYNGDRLISEKTAENRITTSPWTVWFSVSTLALGVGKCHVELYADDTLLVSKPFEIVEKLPSTPNGNSTN